MGMLKIRYKTMLAHMVDLFSEHSRETVMVIDASWTVAKTCTSGTASY